MGIGITIDNIAGTEEFCENMDTRRTTGIDFSNAPPDLPATFVEFVGKKGTKLKDTASGFEMKVGAGASSPLATAASVAASTIPEPTVNGAYLRRKNGATLSWSAGIPAPVAGLPTGTYGIDVDVGTGFTGIATTVQPTVPAAVADNLASFGADGNTADSGIAKGAVALRPAAAVAGNLCEFDANKDPIDSGVIADLVAASVKGTFPASDTVNTDSVIATVNDCVLIFDVTAASKVLTLPATATAGIGKSYFVYLKGDVGKTLTVTPNGVETVNGGATVAVNSNPPYKLHMVTCVGSGKWWVNEV